MEKVTSFFLFFALMNFSALKAASTDTIRIMPQNINIKFLKEGTHRYLVYFKMKKDSVRVQAQFWTRSITRKIYHGLNVIEINQSWEDKDSIMHVVKSISDAKSMKPLFHDTWWKVQRGNNSNKIISQTKVDFTSRIVEVDGRKVVFSDTTKRYKAIWDGFKSTENQYFLNWHSDLEAFPLLPYKQDVVFEIPFYEPGSSASLTKVHYKVTGTDFLTGYNDQSIECWLLEHETTGNKEVFWISKKTREVLKLEQVINGSIYRYKIKLVFSN